MRITLACMLLGLMTPIAVADDTTLAKPFRDLQPTLQKFCFECHSAKAKEGELDLERYSSLELVRKDLEPWQRMIQQLETREMPPKGHLQPSETQRAELLDWIHRLLDGEARASSGQRGSVPLHRLSNVEYNNTIRDLTGIDLRPTKDFPADGAAGEGFTNAAEALGMSPALMSKYVKVAKDIADHAVLLPDGFRFSKSATRRDWTDESLASLRKFYRQFTQEGGLPLKPYITALVEHRSDLESGSITLQQVAIEQRLSPKYLSIVWETLNDSQPSFPLDRIRSQWKNATAKDVDQIVAEVSSWFERLWEFPKIGSYVNTHRQKAKDPTFGESHTISIQLEPAPGQSEIVLRLVARGVGGPPATVIWSHPRFAGQDLPTLSLCDYESFGPRYEVDYAKLFANTEAYLAAVIENAFDAELSVQQIATKHRVDPAWLQRWITVANLQPPSGDAAHAEPGHVVPAVTWQLLDEPAPNLDHPAINGWRPKGAELPILIANASDETKLVPGRMSPHAVAVHPTPTEFVAVVWTSPITGRVRVHGKVDDAHAACGNGVVWRLETQSPTRSAIVAEGTVDLGKSLKLTAQEWNVVQGDRMILAVDARDRSHVCDLTEIQLVISDADNADRVWDLASDTANDVIAGNPHDDSYGNQGVWSFVKGAAKDRPTGSAASRARSMLAQWRAAASVPENRNQADDLAVQLRALLTGQRPKNEADPNGALYDQLVSVSGPLLREIDIVRLSGSGSGASFGLSKERFGKHPRGKPVDANSLVAITDEVLELRLPAALFRDRAFVVDGKLDEDAVGAAVQFQVLADATPLEFGWVKDAPIVTVANGEGRYRLLAGLTEFRRVFPPNVCYPHVIPLDEVVCLKTFHREDEPLRRLFLNDAQTEELERLWREHRFISKFPLVENEYLPLFIGFVTQDQPKELVEFFEDKRATFQAWADEFERVFQAAAPQQRAQLFDFASQAYRRPLTQAEMQSLESLYRTFREKGSDHEEAFRSLLARVLISPSFLLHLEPRRSDADLADDWILASRLSYFLWSSMPDEELRRAAHLGQLRQPEILADQTTRMLKDDRIRSLAIEFGTQWIHVRGFDQFNDKNEKLFPEFDLALRSAMYEESILLFQDLFRHGGSAVELIDADYTFLNQTLARHYGIEGVVGSDFRRVNGVKKFGRGGVLGLASVQAKQAGASRTSPVLRGNWVVETLLGERLPNPPPNVPQLPESEIGNSGLSMREITQRHVADAHCAKCHQRIDPFGFALEHYDPIGRRREKDLGGLPVDASATLRSGTQFEGIDGLRGYLMAEKKQDIVRLFYQRLLGYALRRSVSISDQLLLDEMMAATEDGEDSIIKAILAIVQSPQFRRTTK